MDGSGVAAVIVVIMMVGAFGFYLPIYVIVVAAGDGNWGGMTIGIVWICGSLFLTLLVLRYSFSKKRRSAKR